MSSPTTDVDRAHAALERVLDYRFADRALLAAALTHPSYAAEHPGSTDYQRLEFLGDAVLELAVTHFIYEELPTASEGEMTLLRAAVVAEPALAAIAVEWGIPGLMLLGRGEDQSGGREKRSILSDIVEALVAAVFLDAGFERVEAIVHEHWAPGIRERAGAPGQLDYKTRLQESLVATGRTVEYTVTETGPQHAKQFTAIVFGSGAALATGAGTSKKRAEQAAARRALANLDKD